MPSHYFEEEELTPKERALLERNIFSPEDVLKGSRYRGLATPQLPTAPEYVAPDIPEKRKMGLSELFGLWPIESRPLSEEAAAGMTPEQAEFYGEPSQRQKTARLMQILGVLGMALGQPAGLLSAALGTGSAGRARSEKGGMARRAEGREAGRAERGFRGREVRTGERKAGAAEMAAYAQLLGTMGGDADTQDKMRKRLDAQVNEQTKTVLNGLSKKGVLAAGTKIPELVSRAVRGREERSIAQRENASFLIQRANQEAIQLMQLVDVMISQGKTYGEIATTIAQEGDLLPTEKKQMMEYLRYTKHLVPKGAKPNSLVGLYKDVFVEDGR
jgi:hypothetical protein